MNVWIRRMRWLVLVGLITASTMAAAVPARAVSAPVPPAQLGVGAAVLVDADTGQILYADHAYRQMDPASITKIMTAYLVIRAGHLSRTVSVSDNAAHTAGSRMRIGSHDRYTILDLLRGLLLPSGNDAAVALAEAESGSVAAFVAEMNRTARQLGAYQTHFVNPNGLPAPGHYSSAYDLALIARAALRLPVFQHLVSTPEDYVTELTRGRTRSLHNSNRLLAVFPGVDGIKTGTTRAAGPCLAASATAGPTQLIAVVLHARDRWQAAWRLLQWGFQHFERRAVVAAAVQQVRGGVRRTVKLVPDTPWWTLVPRASESPRLTVLTTHPRLVAAPVRRGQVLGRAYALLDGEPIGARALVAQDAVPRRVLPRLTRPHWRWPW